MEKTTNDLILLMLATICIVKAALFLFITYCFIFEKQPFTFTPENKEG